MFAICDPIAVEQMAEAGVGNRALVRIGGKLDMPSIGLRGEPAEIAGRVRALTDGDIDRLYDAATNHGAIGGKLLGAGGGGYFLFLCQFDKWHEVAEELEKLGGKVTSFHFESQGLETWEARR